MAASYEEQFQRDYDGEPVPLDLDEPPRNRALTALWAVSAGLVLLSVASLVWMLSALADPVIFSGPQFIVVLLVPSTLFVPGAIGIILALAVQASTLGRLARRSRE
jgi:hypothetical protein